MPEEVATLRLTAKDETAAAFQAAALNIHRVKSASDDFHRTSQETFERGRKSVELFGMSLGRALSVTAVAEFGRRAYDAFANFDRALTMTRLNTGATQEQMEKLSATIDNLEKTTRQAKEQLIAGFQTYMQTSGQTFDQAMAIFPKIAATATATQNDINSVATAIGAAARNLRLTTEQQAKALDQLTLAATKNLKDLGQYLPGLTNALRGIGAEGPQAFQSILSALMTIRGGFGSTQEAVGALEQAIRAVTQSRDKGFAAMGREIERRVKEGQDFVVAMMQTLEANNMLTDQALRRWLGKGGPALLALQQLRDMWQQNRENFEALGRAQGEVERRNKAIQQDSKAAAELLAIAFGNVLDEVGKFLAVSGVPKALTDTADALQNVNDLIATIRESVEGKGLDWDKFLGTSGLDRQFEHFAAVWKLRWQRLKDFMWEGTTPGGKPGRESEDARRLRQELEWLEREMGVPGGIIGPLQPPAAAPRAPAAPYGRDIHGRAYPVPQRFVGSEAFPFDVGMKGARSSVWELSGEGSTNIEDRRGISLKGDELIDVLEETASELKRLNDFYELLRVEGNGGTPAGAYGFAGGGGGFGGGGATGGRPGGGGPGGGTQAPSEMPSGAGGPGLYDPITGRELMGGVGADSASRGRGGHQGVDIGAAVGTPVYAAKEGKVVKFGTDNFGQPTVTLKHPDGTYSRYLHMADRSVKVGDTVKGGQQIGTSGTARGVPHLHFERWRGEPGKRGSRIIDPMKEFGWGKGALPRGGQQARTSMPAQSQPGDQPQQAPQRAPRTGPAGADVTGRMTWFNPAPHTYTDPNTGITWSDTSARARGEGPHASGLPISTPGIATAGRGGLGGWYEVTLPDGRKFVTQKTDVGPPGVVDLNAALASQAYPRGPQSMPQGRATARFLGRNLPEGMRPGLQRPREAEPETGPSGTTAMHQWRAWRRDLEKPIRMHIEAPEAPSRFVPRVRRASAANVQNRELHRERERSYADMEE